MSDQQSELEKNVNQTDRQADVQADIDAYRAFDGGEVQAVLPRQAGDAWVDLAGESGEFRNLPLENLEPVPDRGERFDYLPDDEPGYAPPVYDVPTRAAPPDEPMFQPTSARDRIIDPKRPVELDAISITGQDDIATLSPTLKFTTAGRTEQSDLLNNPDLFFLNPTMRDFVHGVPLDFVQRFRMLINVSTAAVSIIFGLVGVALVFLQQSTCWTPLCLELNNNRGLDLLTLSVASSVLLAIAIALATYTVFAALRKNALLQHGVLLSGKILTSHLLGGMDSFNVTVSAEFITPEGEKVHTIRSRDRFDIHLGEYTKKTFDGNADLFTGKPCLILYRNRRSFMLL